jgi:hypothetical protein
VRFPLRCAHVLTTERTPQVIGLVGGALLAANHAHGATASAGLVRSHIIGGEHTTSAHQALL